MQDKLMLQENAMEKEPITGLVIKATKLDTETKDSRKNFENVLIPK